MKMALLKILSLQLLLFCSLLLTSCYSGSGKKVQDKLPLLDRQTMTAKQAADWEAFERAWRFDYQAKMIHKYGLKQDCITCSNFFFDFEAEVDGEGHMTLLPVTHVVLSCDHLSAALHEKITNEVIADFRKMVLPKSMYHSRVKQRMGVALKC